MPSQYDVAVAEIKRLRKIVDKLPRTSDAVPITPGMNCRFQDDDAGVLSITEDCGDIFILLRDGEGYEHVVCPDEITGTQ